MSERRIIRTLGIECPGEMRIYSYEEEPLAEGQFQLETLYTGFSAGTELTFFNGTNPYLHSRWDDEFGLFIDGEPSTRLPMWFLGYMEAGRVTASRTRAVDVGQIVGMSYGHKTGHTADANRDFFVTLPPHIDPILGIYLAQMGPICANGLLHAAADRIGGNVRDLGDGVSDRFVLVTGGGVVGILTALFAHHLGAAEVAVADVSATRLAAAAAFGLQTIDENAIEPWEYCKSRWSHGPNDRGADVVFQCRGRPANLQAALRSLRPQGRVIDLAFYQGGSVDLRLGEEFHHNGLSIVCAQIGRVPRGLAPEWSRGRLSRSTIELLERFGTAIKDHLITDVVGFDNAPLAVAELASRKRDAIQLVFQCEPV